MCVYEIWSKVQKMKQTSFSTFLVLLFKGLLSKSASIGLFLHKSWCNAITVCHIYKAISKQTPLRIRLNSASLYRLLFFRFHCYYKYKVWEYKPQHTVTLPNVEVSHRSVVMNRYRCHRWYSLSSFLDQKKRTFYNFNRLYDRSLPPSHGGGQWRGCF